MTDYVIGYDAKKSASQPNAMPTKILNREIAA